MIGIVVPAHNEEWGIGACVASLVAAARHEALKGEPVAIVVAADSCSDRTAAIAAALGAHAVALAARNVGVARAVGARWALERGARWLAFTDADSTVAPDWVSVQLAVQSALRCDAVCGTVQVADWAEHLPLVKRRHEARYVDADGHRHIHGANMGVTAAAYARAGGFPSLRRREDVALVRALHASGASIAWSARPRVTTSARRHARAPGGFSSALRSLARDGRCDATAPARVTR